MLNSFPAVLHGAVRGCDAAHQHTQVILMWSRNVICLAHLSLSFQLISAYKWSFIRACNLCVKEVEKQFYCVYTFVYKSLYFSCRPLQKSHMTFRCEFFSFFLFHIFYTFIELICDLFTFTCDFFTRTSCA